MLLDKVDLLFKVLLKGNLFIKLILQLNQPGESASILFADALKLELAFAQ